MSEPWSWDCAECWKILCSRGTSIEQVENWTKSLAELYTKSDVLFIWNKRAKVRMAKSVWKCYQHYKIVHPEAIALALLIGHE